MTEPEAPEQAEPQQPSEPEPPREPEPALPEMPEPQPPKNVLILNLAFGLEYVLFIAMNLLDLVLTLLFLRRGASEANPAARWALVTMGKNGFIVYKIALTLAVIALAETVARKRRLAARLLMWFGIVAVGTVVAMSYINYLNYMRAG